MFLKFILGKCVFFSPFQLIIEHYCYTKIRKITIRLGHLKIFLKNYVLNEFLVKLDETSCTILLIKVSISAHFFFGLFLSQDNVVFVNKKLPSYLSIIQISLYDVCLCILPANINKY